MNLILFDRAELGPPLARTDPRARHLLEVLRRQPGEPFDAGIVNGPRGKGRIIAIASECLTLEFAWETDTPPVPAIVLLVGLPRPQTARDILREATTMGVAALHFVTSERGERSYAQSPLWTRDEWRRHIRQGAEQAFCTRIPEVTYSRALPDAIADLTIDGTRLLLDNYEASTALGSMRSQLAPPVAVAIGSERGWTTGERELFRHHGFQFVHLGARVLRTETACIAALTLVRAGLGLI